MSVLSPWIGGTRRLVLHAGQYGLLLGPVRRAFVEPAAAAHDELLRLLLCHYGKQLWAVGLNAGRCGNLSARGPQRETIFITPRAANKARLSVSDIQRVSLRAPVAISAVSVEFPMHRACYLARPGVGAVIHTHAAALTAAGIRCPGFADMLPEAAAALGAVKLIPHAPSGSDLLAERVFDAVGGGASLLLLERHGAVTVGRNLAEAYELMEFGELTAKTALLASGDSRLAPARDMQ